LLAHDTRFTDRVWRRLGLDDHTSDLLVEQHMLQVCEVDMRATMMPESEIQRTSAGRQS
jgi:hypothetical protein